MWSLHCSSKYTSRILVVVTHNATLASRFPVRYELRHANLCPVGA